MLTHSWIGIVGSKANEEQTVQYLLSEIQKVIDYTESLRIVSKYCTKLQGLT